MVRAIRPQPGARPIFQPEPTLPGLVLWNFEPLLLSGPFDPMGEPVTTSTDDTSRRMTLASTGGPGSRPPAYFWPEEEESARLGCILDGCGGSLSGFPEASDDILRVIKSDNNPGNTELRRVFVGQLHRPEH